MTLRVSNPQATDDDLRLGELTALIREVRAKAMTGIDESALAPEAELHLNLAMAALATAIAHTSLADMRHAQAVAAIQLGYDRSAKP